MNTKETAAQAALAAVNVALAPWIAAVNARDLIFSPVATFLSRIVNAVSASDVDVDVIADVKTIARKLTGRRATPKPAPAPAPAPVPPAPPAATASASQLSFDSRIENFDKLIQLLLTQPGYAPNEADLKIPALQTLLTTMKADNLAVINANTALSNARITRNKALYDPSTGLVIIANDVTNYIKSVFGPSSPQYKQVSKVKFQRIKI